MPANLDKALPYHLTHNAGVIALVGTRIHPMKLPQGTILPACTFQQISTNAVQSHREPSVLPSQRYQITAYGVMYEDAVNIAKAIKTALDGYHGNMGISPYVTEIEACLYKNENSTDDPETGLYWRQIDFLIMWKE